MTTPMMQQFREAKEHYPGTIVFFRNGDFYELFEEDAEVGSRLLGIALTRRDKEIPMAGVPHHALDRYLGKLLQAGHRVAICEQMEDPRSVKGRPIRREVVRVVTPGTLTEDDLLDPQRSNHLLALVPPGGRTPAGLAWVELSTGLFQAADVLPTRLADEVLRLTPSECLIAEATTEETAALLQRVRDALPQLALTPRPDWTFDAKSARDTLFQHFGVATMAGFGFDDQQPCLTAAGALLLYLRETLKASLAHLTRLRPYSEKRFLVIDDVTRRSLELTRTLRDNARLGSLLAAIDRTMTPMGARLLHDWLLAPLAERPAITARLDAVEELLQEHGLRRDLRTSLADVADLQRLTARASTGHASPRDLSAVGRTLALLPEIKTHLIGGDSALLREMQTRLEVCPELREMLETALMPDPPINLREGGIIRCGYNKDLDELHEDRTSGKKWLLQFQAAEQVRTGIPSLKVGFTEGYGYYIEVTHTHKNKVPENYRLHRSLKNANRYVTGELLEKSDKVVNAEERIKQLEYDLFVQLRERVAAQTNRLMQTAEVLATLDVLASLAELAAERNYCRPTLTDDPVLAIEEGRHPVLEQTLPPGTFVPNGTTMGPDDGAFLLVTGPNMGGKCIRGDSLVFTNRGLIPIEMLKPASASIGEFTLLRCGVQGREGVVHSTHFYNGGLCPTVRLRTKLGFCLEGTPEHRIWVRHAEGSECWKPLGELAAGDWVALERGADLWGRQTALSNEPTKHYGNLLHYRLPSELNADLAYLMGLLVGDGTLVQVNNFRLTTGDPFLADEFRRILAEQFGYRLGPAIGRFEYRVSSKELRDFLAANGLGYHKSTMKEVPECILRAPRPFIIAFLQGLFDTDGTVENRYGNVSYATSSPRLAHAVQMLLLNLGIVASLRCKITKANPSSGVFIHGEDAIRFYRIIGFRLPRKQAASQLASALRRPNKGGIPHLTALLKQVQSRIVAKKGKPIALKQIKTVNSIFYTYIPLGRNLSYGKLGELMDYCRRCGVDCPELESIHDQNYFYDRVQTIESGFTEVYDLSVPDGNAFIANGFVNHNSVFLRQTALLTLMAQMGSFVPARAAQIGLADRIFTRVGASDELNRAQSTFMVEMTEAANILNNATPRSLVILDEIGRGTSTYDGVSLAWGITEYLHDRIGCRTLFATHYHELAQLAESLPGLRNCNALVHEGPDGIVFLHKIAAGSADKSYGIHVAQRAGVPEEVLVRAREVLAELERHHVETPDRPGRIRRPRSVQRSLFANMQDPILQALRELDLDRMTPEEVMAAVRRWKRDLR